ncbi:hypothetical protein GCM10020001_063580 [Nonomuraea salmonea]
MTSTDTPTMLALHQTTLGGPDVLRLTELPRPEPGLGEILVAVHAAGLNPTDVKHRATSIFLPPPAADPGLGRLRHRDGDRPRRHPLRAG